ncbi:MAG: GPW/gp25 family protein [Bacteroidota bacterium]|jgi:phage baseplate assembly protein W
MKYDYFKLPIPFDDILSRNEIEKTNIRISINQRIQLLLLSYFGECRFNPDFGCVVWEYDFTNVSNENAWRDLVVGSLTQALQKNEPRLQNVKIKVSIKEEEFEDPTDNSIKRVKRRLDVNVQANLLETNEPYSYSQLIYVSPISLD